jgi:site-specific DNA-methyltransferase (adenine-specific)
MKDLKTDNLWLMQGDCLERMKEIPDGSVDMVLTDPPYGTTACKWDSIIPLEPMWEQLKRIIKPNGAIVITASQPFTTTLISSNMSMFKYCWVWDKVKPNGHLVAKIRPMQRTEDICVFGHGKINYYPIMVERDRPKQSKEYSRTEIMGGISNGISSIRRDKYPQSVLVVSNASQKGKIHPTQKPLGLMEYLIKTYTKENETILDFTFGSCTTGAACVNLSRNFIGIELDEKYFDIGKERISSIVNLNGGAICKN